MLLSGYDYCICLGTYNKTRILLFEIFLLSRSLEDSDTKINADLNAKKKKKKGEGHKQ